MQEAPKKKQSIVALVRTSSGLGGNGDSGELDGVQTAISQFCAGMEANLIFVRNVSVKIYKYEV